MNLTDRAVVAQIFKALTDTGTAAPKDVTAAYDLAVRVSAAGRAMHPGQDGLTAAVTAALTAGRDPGEDKAVIRALTLTAIANPGVSAAVDADVYGRLQEALHEHADTIVETWRGPFDKSATALTIAHGVLGDIALADTTTVVKIGAQAADAWSAATKAVKVIDTIVNGWSALGDISRLAPRNQIAAPLRIVTADLDQWVEHRLERRKLDPWDAVREGMTLSLPTYSEYHARITAIEQSAAAAAAQAEQIRRDRMTGRRTTPVG